MWGIIKNDVRKRLMERQEGQPLNEEIFTDIVLDACNEMGAKHWQNVVRAKRDLPRPLPLKRSYLKLQTMHFSLAAYSGFRETFWVEWVGQVVHHRMSNSPKKRLKCTVGLPELIEAV